LFEESSEKIPAKKSASQKGFFTSWAQGCCPIFFDGRILIEVEATDLAPHLHSSSHPIELPGGYSALPFRTLVRTIQENESPVTAGQTSSINFMRSERLNSAVLHRQSPFGTMRSGGEAKSVADDDVAGLVDHGLPSIPLRSTGVQRNAQTNSGSEGDVAVGGVSKPSGESGIPFDNDHLGQFRHLVAFAGESNPFSDVLVFHGVVLR
jgi:hypothetical protein